MNAFIISSLKKRTKYTKRFYKNLSDYNKDLLNNQANESTRLIIQAKEKQIAKMSAKLDNPNTAPRTYWSIISRFLNKRKMPAIPPILADGKLVSDFKIKSELFNSHFAAQCTPVKNASKLLKFKYRTDKRLNSFTIDENDIFLIIKNLNADKAHGWDNISIRMIQLCGKEIILPLQLLFKTKLEEGIFPGKLEKNNVVPVHKKESKNLIKNSRAITIFSKILERLIFNSLFNYFMQSKLFTEWQSGFIPGDSCVAQLLSITHEFIKSGMKV